MQEVFEKIIEKLEELKKSETEREDLCDEEGCGDGEEIYEDGKSQGRFEQVVRIIEIVKQEAEQYEECYKDCGDCEAYNKEKHHCPKFCKVITEAVREIEENHNIKGKLEMTYKGMKKDVNTGLMISAYNCKCSVCGWETGNQGTRFSYCPKCGAKMDEVNKPKAYKWGYQMMNNKEIREKIAKKRLKHYEVAQAIGITQYTFSHWLQTEMDTEKKSIVLKAIDSIKI